MKPSAVLAALMLLTPCVAGARPSTRGWFVSFGEGAWAYSPVGDDVAPRRARPARFLHLGDDGTALELTAAVNEDTSARTARPALSVGEGFSIWSGAWRRTADGEIQVELAFQLSSGVVFSEPPGARTIAATMHGRHLMTADGPLVPLGFAYSSDSGPLRRQLFEHCCSGPGRHAACRTIRR